MRWFVEVSSLNAGTDGQRMTVEAATWQGALAQVLDELWQGGSRHLYLDGGELVRQGLQGALVDELTLFWVPVTLGGGIPLFTGPLPTGLRPVSSAVLPSGLVRVIYHPA